MYNKKGIIVRSDECRRSKANRKVISEVGRE